MSADGTSPPDEGGPALPDEAAHVRKVDGAPGAGKTTTLFDAVEGELSEGYSPREILYLTFTNSGNKEVEERLAGVFGDDDLADDSASTFHSAALSVCSDAGVIGDGAGTVIGQNTNYAEREAFDGDPFAEFAERNGLRYEADDEDLSAQQEGGGVDTAANALYATAEWLTLTQRDDEAFRRAPVDSPIPDGMVLDLLAEWREFKEEHPAGPLYEHHDYVDAAVDLADDGYTPGTKVLIIDEFQDLSPQEYLLYKKWRDSESVERAVIAGDANQSVYSFRAARPFYFINTPVNEVSDRKASYRVPEKPAAVARGILEAHSRTDPRGFRSAGGGENGAVHCSRLSTNTAVAEAAADAVRRVGREGWGADADLGERDPRAFMLARTNRHADAICRALREHGVPYLRLKDTSWQNPWRDDRLTEMYCAMRDYSRGARVRVDEFATLVDKTPLNRERIEEVVDGSPGPARPLGEWSETVDAERALFGVETVDDALAASDYDAFTQLASGAALRAYKRDALTAAVDSDCTHLPAHVRVGTIHAAKGLEAPSVFLFDGYTKTLADAYSADPEQAAEEHRLYYVGATRAMNELTIARNFVGGYTFPGLEGRVPTSTPDESEAGGGA